MPGCTARLRSNSQKIFAIALRVLTVLQLFTGLGFIGFACYLSIPPDDSLTLGMIVIGVLAVVTSVFGLIVSCTSACCLTVYLTLGTCVTLAQAGFSLYLFIAPQDAVNKLLNNKPGNESKFHDAVYTGRWVFLVVVACQVLAMVLAVVLRSITPQDYQEFEEEQYQERKAASEKQLDLLKEKVLGVEAAHKKSPSKSAIVLAPGAPTLPEQRHSLFRTDSADPKLEEGDIEFGTIPAMPATTDARGAWGAPTLPQAPAAWPAEQRQPQQQRSFKPSWSKAAKH